MDNNKYYTEWKKTRQSIVVPEKLSESVMAAVRQYEQGRRSKFSFRIFEDMNSLRYKIARFLFVSSAVALGTFRVSSVLVKIFIP